MGTQLNIKSEDAYRLASELAELTGESLTTAVTEALRERLDRQLKAHERTARLERIRTLAADLRAHMQPPFSSADPDDFYDENGLPR